MNKAHYIELVASGEPVSEDRSIRVIFRGLPDQFEVAKEYYLLLKEGLQLTLPTRLFRLRGAEQREGGKPAVDGTAFVAKEVVAKNGANRSDLVCYHCRGWGHIKQDCRAPRGKLKISFSRGPNNTIVKPVVGGPADDEDSIRKESDAATV
jgi:hypothetical protein